MRDIFGDTLPKEMTRKKIKLTKKLQAALTRYEIELRYGDSIVYHIIHQNIKTTLDPIQFAVYELAITAMYVCEQASGKPLFQNHYKNIAAKDGFNLPFVSEDHTLMQQSSLDYRYAKSLIRKAELYPALLD